MTARIIFVSEYVFLVTAKIKTSWESRKKIGTAKYISRYDILKKKSNVEKNKRANDESSAYLR